MSTLLVAVLATLLHAGNAAPQHHRSPRDVAARAAATTPEDAEKTVASGAAEKPEPSRRGRQLSDLLAEYENSRAADADLAETNDQRDEKSIAFYDYLRPPFYDLENEVLSRTNPDRGNFPDSPIYYIRLPPTPYMFVPGLGYVSPPPQTPTMSPFINLPLDFVANGKPSNIYHWSTPNNNNNYQQKPVSKPDLNFVSNGKPTSVYRPQSDKFGNQNYRPSYRPKPEINLDFVSNGKPTNIYRPNFDNQNQQTPQTIIDFVANGKPTNLFRPSYEESISPGDSTIYRPVYDPIPKPKPTGSNVHNLNKGPYVFNGRPNDMYLLRNSYNALYEDALQNFYP